MTAEREKISAAIQQNSGTVAPMIGEEDLDFLAQAKAKMSQKDILKMYVGNWQSLDLRQRRKVMGFVQAQRAKHAK